MVLSAPVYTEPSSVFTINNWLLSRCDTFDHLKRDGAVDVIETDIQNSRVQPFNLTRDVVAVLHYDDVILIPCGNRDSKKQGTAEDKSSEVHGHACL